MSKTKVEIIYQDKDIVVVNKPCGVSVTKDRSDKAELKDILTKQFGKDFVGSLRLVHRLDKDTSGVMILAKNKQTQSALSAAFAKGKVKKTYLALVSAKLSESEGVIEAALIENPHRPGQMYVPKKKGKPAVTKWRLLADFGSIALLAVEPLTGRTHQIRVHMRHAGMPLAIDPLYGNSRPIFLSDFKSDYNLGKEKQEKPLIDRLTLHAYQIEFAEPQTNWPSCFIADLDKKFAATIKMLTKHNPKGPDAFANCEDFLKITSAKRLD